MKKLVLSIISVVIIFGVIVGSVIVTHAVLDTSSEEEKTDYELLPTEEIPAYYEEDNLYVELNNALIRAINDYEDGKISAEEYKEICDEIHQKIDEEEEFNEVVEDEQEFNERIGEER